MRSSITVASAFSVGILAAWSFTLAADIRNVNWGDSVQAVLAATEDKLAASAESQPVGVTTLEGTAQIGDESFAVTYTFYDNELVGVYVNAFWSNSSPKSNRPAAYNPLQTRAVLDSLLREKYGQKTESSAIRNGEFVNLAGVMLEWSRMCPAGDTMTSAKWSAPKHTVELSTITFDGMRSCSVAYHSSLPTRAKYEAALKAKDEQDEARRKSRTKKTLEGL